MFRSFSFVVLFVVAMISAACFSSPAEAHHGGFRSNGFGVRGVPVNNNQFFFQQTNRGPFGRVRSQTTIFGR